MQGKPVLLSKVLVTTLVLATPLVPVAKAGPKEDRQQKKQDAINQAHSAEIESAKRAAADWLPFLDAGKYAESWKQSAPFLQANIPEAAWEKRLNATRKPLEPFIERTLSTTEYRDQFPGLPQGQYVALVWESYFGARHQVLESLIMAADNGQWKPIGYAVQ